MTFATPLKLSEHAAKTVTDSRDFRVFGFTQDTPRGIAQQVVDAINQGAEDAYRLEGLDK